MELGWYKNSAEQEILQNNKIISQQPSGVAILDWEKVKLSLESFISGGLGKNWDFSEIYPSNSAWINHRLLKTEFVFTVDTNYSSGGKNVVLMELSKFSALQTWKR